MSIEFPREKLKRLGPHSLEDHELISLLFSSGTKKESVFDISKRVMYGFNRQELKTAADFSELSKRYALGDVHTSRLMASIELGKRLFDEPKSFNQIKGYDDIYEILKDMQYLQKEHVRGLYLNTRNFIIRNEVISIGSLDANIVHPREIFKPALEYSAYALIIAHNHPSGDPTPSSADVSITNKLREIGELMQIPLIDHIIIGKNDYFSFSREQILENQPNY